MTTSTSIVTSMYNAKPGIVDTIDRLLLPSLVNNGNSSMELILIDDCSPLKKETSFIIDDFMPDLKRTFGLVTFKRNPENLGFAKSFNRGIRMASGNNLLVTNDDVYFPTGSIQKLIGTLNGPENFSMVGPISNNIELWSYQYCKQAPTLNSYNDEEISRLESFSSWLSNTMENKTVSTDNLCGFCFAANADFLDEFGGFGEKYLHGYFEDTDLIQRINTRYGIGRVGISLDTFVSHGGVNGASQSFKQLPVKMFYSLMVNSFKYANTWGYGTLLKRTIYGIQSQFGKGTVSELLPDIKF